MASFEAPVGDAPIVGRILDSDGRPAVGVAVKVYLTNSNPLGETAPLTSLTANVGAALAGNAGSGLAGNAGATYRILASGEARTDASGVFAIDPSSDGDYNLEAVKSEDFKVFRSSVKVDRKKKENVGNLTLEPTGTLTGRITAPGSPLVTDFEGADVFIPGTDYVAKANASGLYTIRNVAVGSFDLSARYASVGRAKVENVLVRPKTTTTIPDLELKVSPPLLKEVVPPSAGPKASVFIFGENFGAVTGETLEVAFGGKKLESVERLGNGGLKVKLPQDASNGNFVVTVQGIQGQPFAFKVLGKVHIEAYDEALELGATRHYVATATDTDGSAVDKPGVFWAEEGGTLTVSATGDVLGKALGMSSLFAFSGSVGDERHISVVERYPTVTTLAGSGQKGSADGVATAASFDDPAGLAVGGDGAVYVCDTGNHRIRKIASDGTVTTLAGAEAGDADGEATLSRFNGPRRLALAPDGSLYVADTGNKKLRKIAAGGTVSTVASGKDFAAVAVSAVGVVYAIDKGRNEVLEVGSGGTSTVLASAADLAVASSIGGSPATSTPTGLAAGPAGTIYLADPNVSRIWKIGGGTVKVLAGSFDASRLLHIGLTDGAGDAAQFNAPRDLAMDSGGVLFVADTENHRIRKITAGGVVTTLAGSGKPERGNGGYADGTGVAARFDEVSGIAVGADGTVFVSDSKNRRIRKISP